MSERTPVFRNIQISNLTGTNVLIPIKIRGLEESPITDITFTNIRITAKQKCVFQNYKRVVLKDVLVNGVKITLE